MVSVPKGVIALALLLCIAAMGVYIIGLPMIPKPVGEGFDAKSKTALRDCEGKYQDCVNQGGNPVDCTGRYNTCSSLAASKNPLVNRGDTSTPMGDRDKQLSAPAALQKSGAIWAPNYSFLYQGLAAESREPSEKTSEGSWYDKVVAFFFGTQKDGFASKNAACEKDFSACVRGGGKVVDCTTIYNKCTGATDVAKAALQTTSTSPIRDASGNLVQYAGKDYSKNDINNPYYFALANTSNPFSREMNAGDYALLQKYALTGAGGDTSSSKAFLASIAARVAADQGAKPPTATQLAAAQGDQEEIPSSATYTSSTNTPLAPHQTPDKIQVQLKPEVASYLTNASLRANVRQDTKNAIADALAAIDNEYEVKYVYA